MALGELYKKALAGIVGTKAQIFDYDDASDFDKLWSQVDQTPAILKDFTETRNRILIIWDGRLDTETNEPLAKLLTPHLTPLDWALAFSIMLLTSHRDHLAVTGGIGIHIIDLTGRNHTSWAIRMRHQLLAEMPWVTLHAPLLPKDSQGICHPYRMGYRAIIDNGDKRQNKALLEEYRPECSVSLVFASPIGPIKANSAESLKSLSRQWTATITQEGDHHDLNNIVGPQIVHSHFQQKNNQLNKNQSHSLTAFLTRMRWFDLMPAEDQESACAISSTAGRHLDIVAIDDQLTGWDAVLRKLIDVQSPSIQTEPSDMLLLGRSEQRDVNFFGSKTAHSLLAGLGIKVEFTGIEVDCDLYTERQFDSICQGGGRRPWLLVLDIRLFTSRKNDEREWYKILATAASKIQELEQDKLAWSGFGDSDCLKDIALDNSLNSKQQEIALTLLPRLCALRWPSVPIIIFSSTGRRTIAAALADYGNIFVANPKPNVLCVNGAENIAEFKNAWHREFSSALKLIDVQKKLLDLVGASESLSADSQEHHHLVVAMDEAGSSDGLIDRIGGSILVVSGGNKKDAISNSVAIQESLRSKGVNYYAKNPAYTDNHSIASSVSTEILDKYTAEEPSDAVNKVITENGNVKFGAFVLHLDNTIEDTSGFADAIYRRGMTRVLEILLADFLPTLFNDLAKVSISIWLPSKQQSRVDSPQEHCLQYDFRYNSKWEGVETLGGWSNAYTIIISAISERHKFSDIINCIHQMKTRVIPYDKQTIKKSGEIIEKSPTTSLHWVCPRCHVIQYPYIEQRRCSCNGISSLCAPDYSVMQHLADRFIGKLKKNRNSFDYSVQPEYCLEIDENKRSIDFIACNRLIYGGQEQESDGFKIAYRNDFFSQDINIYPSSRPICTTLRSKLAEIAKRSKGNTLIELAGMFTRVNSSQSALPPMLSTVKASVQARIIATSRHKMATVTPQAGSHPEKGGADIKGHVEIEYKKLWTVSLKPKYDYIDHKQIQVAISEIANLFSVETPVGHSAETRFNAKGNRVARFKFYCGNTSHSFAEFCRNQMQHECAVWSEVYGPNAPQ